MAYFSEATLIAPKYSSYYEIFDEFRERIVSINFEHAHGFCPDELNEALGGASSLTFFTTWKNPSLERWLSRNADRVHTTGLIDCLQTQVDPSRGHYVDIYGRVSAAMGATFNREEFAHPHRSRTWETFDSRFYKAFSNLGRYWVLHPDTAAYKTLPPKFWTEFIRSVRDKDPSVKLLVVGTKSRQFIQKDACVIFVPTDFSLSTFLVSAAERFVGVDSCFLHYADLQRVPSLALIRGGADQDRWGLTLTPRRATVIVDDITDPDPRMIADAFCSLGS